ncbi:hypothetical protein IAT38_003413 [Cryptococcus sp. DSM 104549]
MSTSSLKQRHYSALSSRIRVLQSNLAETEMQLELMAHQLNSTAKLGIHCGSQFMAVSRLLDKELKDITEAAAAQEQSGEQPAAK